MDYSKDTSDYPLTKAFAVGAAFVLTCALIAGTITGTIFAIAEGGLDCDASRAALEEYRIQNVLTMSELERLEKLIGRWGSTRY
jgi:hypothetical protein